MICEHLSWGAVIDAADAHGRVLGWMCKKCLRWVDKRDRDPQELLPIGKEYAGDLPADVSQAELAGMGYEL